MVPTSKLVWEITQQHDEIVMEQKPWNPCRTDKGSMINGESQKYGENKNESHSIAPPSVTFPR